MSANLAKNTFSQQLSDVDVGRRSVTASISNIILDEAHVRH